MVLPFFFKSYGRLRSTFCS